MKRFFIFLLLLINSYLFSETSSKVMWDKKVDWENNKIEIILKSPLNIEDATLSSVRMKAENWIQDNFTNIFLKNIMDIKINSLMDVSDIINNSPEIYYLLDVLGESLVPSQNILTTNLESLDSLYSFPIYPDFVSVFYKQSQHNRQLEKLDHREYGDFTGLIIYVPKELPLYKKGKTGELTKVLFPKIYDEEGYLVLDYTMIDPDYIKKWGMVLYTDKFDESLYQKRVGITPLRIVAKGLFGKNSSDIIISSKEADKLKGSSDNLKIISQARIIIIN